MKPKAINLVLQMLNQVKKIKNLMKLKTLREQVHKSEIK